MRPTAWLAAGLVLPLLTASPAAGAGSCAMAGADRVWLKGAVKAWRKVAAPAVGLRPGAGPVTVVYDARCAWRAEAPASARWAGSPHGGAVPLPDGKRLPPVVASFAAPYDGDRKVFVAMGLPSVWRAGGVRSDDGLERLMTAVFLHEMAHTRQFPALAPELARLTRKWGLPDDLDDDSLQARFKDDQAYRDAWSAERDLLYRAAAAPDIGQARALAREAALMMRVRRARWFTGPDAKWAELEDVFLTLEGAGQWTAYRYLVDKRGGGLAADRALTQIRANRSWWSQEQGLGLFLVLDRLAPEWKARVFRPTPVSARELLEAAVAGGARPGSVPNAGASNAPQGV